MNKKCTKSFETTSMKLSSSTCQQQDAEQKPNLLIIILKFCYIYTHSSSCFFFILFSYQVDIINQIST